MAEIDEKIYDKAVRFLSIRLHTTGELLGKLKTRGFAEEAILPVLQKLEEQQFLDDRRFAEIFVDNLKRYKDWGYYGIKAKLLARKIPSELADEALREFFSPADELRVAERFAKKTAVRADKGPDSRRWEKLARALQSRGFRSEALRKVLAHFA